MKRLRCNRRSFSDRLLSLLLTAVMTVVTVFAAAPGVGKAAETTITSMDYYSAGDGPVITQSDATQASFGFVMPVFNGGAATWDDVASDLAVNVKVDGQWVDIDEVKSFVYNSNWGHWHDSGFHGYWFVLSQTTEIQLVSKANPSVTLDYTLNFIKLGTTTITSMTPTQGPELTAGVTGGSGFTYPTFNGDSSIKYSQVADDLAVFVWSDDSNEWVNLEGNASSGWIYDKNWGQFTDGGGGYWFTVEKTTKVRLASKSDPSVTLDYTIKYEEPERTSYKITANGDTTFTAGDTGAIGLPLPLIDGGNPVSSELSGFVYEVLINGSWVDISDGKNSGFKYSDNGYTNSSSANQWGYWVDGIYGLWFQPIQEDMQFRIGYPTDGIAGHAINDNYVTYTFIGNPDAPRPDPVDYEDIALSTNNNASLDGWKLIWNDEFNGSSLDTTKWSYQIGNGKTDSGNEGWGNNELEYYTDKPDNVYVSDGKLNITAKKETVTDSAEGTFNTTSGRIRTLSKDGTLFSFKYGRVDFCAKLPDGAGIWPALWMLPSDPSIYGVWAASGEIDVMEARGRITDSVCGTIHYGGTWPANTSVSGDYYFPEGETFDSDFHVYSLVWEQDKLKWYVDGKCFYVLSNDNWYSSAAPNNPYAPFDQEFYILMNVAAGGWFDSGIVPDDSAYPATMEVEYVRVYQAEQGNLGTYTDNSSGIDHSTGGTTPSESNPETTEASSEAPATTAEASSEAPATTEASSEAPATTEASSEAPATTEASSEAPATTEASSEAPANPDYGIKSHTDTSVTFYTDNADFAIIHYIINDGGQLNTGMNNTAGTSDYTYTISDLKPGDIIKYQFTYKPVDAGALDTDWFTYIVPDKDDSTVTVSFKNGTDIYYSETVSKGSIATLPTAPAKDGSLFIGWFTEDIGTVTDIDSAVTGKAYNVQSKVSSDTTLYAGWLSAGTIIKDSNDNMSAGSDNSGFYLLGAQYRQKTATKSAGLRFMARISSSLIKSIEQLNEANVNLKPDSANDTGIGYGMVLTTADRLSDTNMLVKDINATTVVGGMKVCPAVNTYKSFNGYSIFTAVVTGIPEASYDLNIAARMYITYADANGIEQTYYYTENESASRAGGAYYTTFRKVFNASSVG